MKFIAKHQSPVHRQTKRWLVAGFSTLLAALAISPAAALAADPNATCSSGYVCVWNLNDFRGWPRAFGVATATNTWRYFEQRKFSVKNRFADRSVWSWDGYGYGYEHFMCLNIGEQAGAARFVGSVAILIRRPADGRC